MFGIITFILLQAAIMAWTNYSVFSNPFVIDVSFQLIRELGFTTLIICCFLNLVIITIIYYNNIIDNDTMGLQIDFCH